MIKLKSFTKTILTYFQSCGLKRKACVILFLAGFTAINPVYPQTMDQPNSPVINITHWIKPKKRIDIKDKYIVLEFWATWCAPCIAAIPHLNKLQNEFRAQKNLAFVSISDENVSKIKQVLPRFAFSSYVVTDITGNTQKAFNVESLPATFLVDNMGNVKWRGDPQNLTRKTIRKFLNDEPISLDQAIKNDGSLDSLYRSYRTVFDDETQKKYFRATNPGYQYSGKSASRISGKAYNEIKIGVKVSALFAQLLHCSESQIKIPDSLKNRAISYCFKSDGLTDIQNGESRLLSLLMSKLHLKLQNAEKMADVYTIRIIDSTKLNAQRVKNTPQTLGGYSNSDNDKVIAIRNSSLTTLENNLTSLLNVPVNFESDYNKSETYDFLISNKSFNDLQNSMKIYGLSLKESSKNLRIYIFN
jgi:thiol-disulfide isomerase/thioredoxin